MEESPKIYGVPIAPRKAKTLWNTVPLGTIWLNKTRFDMTFKFSKNSKAK